MSEIEIERLASLITEPNKKMQNKHILIMIIGLLIITTPITIMLGMDLQSWKTWRSETTSKLSEHEQRIKNQEEINYINHLKIK